MLYIAFIRYLDDNLELSSIFCIILYVRAKRHAIKSIYYLLNFRQMKKLQFRLIALKNRPAFKEIAIYSVNDFIYYRFIIKLYFIAIVFDYQF